MSRRDMKRLQLLLKGLGPGTRLTLSSLVDFTMAVRKRVGWARAVEVNERPSQVVIRVRLPWWAWLGCGLVHWRVDRRLREELVARTPMRVRFHLEVV